MELRPLSELFEPATEERWRKAVDAALKGGDFEKRLVSRTTDGIRVEPLYAAADPIPQPVRAPGSWRVSQRVDHPDAEKAAEQALTDLEGGADALTLVHEAASSAHGFGLALDSVESLDAALTSVMLPLIALRLDAGPRGFEAAHLLKKLIAKRGEDMSALDIDLGLDPIGVHAAGGELTADWEASAASAVGDFPNARAMLADGRPYHEAGASEAQELAAVLATATAYLRALESRGIPLERARDAIAILLVADANEFLTIAKFRAIRRLWARVEQACGLEPTKPLRVLAETAWRMMSRRDPYVNIIRTAMAATSAGLGGADSVTALPYTQPLGLPDAFARRVVRNSQLILLEESNLARVSDPAAGSGGFEALTDQLATAAWAAFQEIEREDGMLASLASGGIQGRIAAIRDERTRRVATRREPLTGASEFPFLAEKPVAVLDVESRRAAPRADGALPSLRLSEPYEALRDASDARLTETGRRPCVFLANLGPVAVHNARSTFAANAFAAGGIEAIGNEGFDDPRALAEAFRQSKAAIACICSSDAVYETEAAKAAKALSEAGASRIYLAGKPANAARLTEAGVHDFLFAGCDLLAMLSQAQASAKA